METAQKEKSITEQFNEMKTAIKTLLEFSKEVSSILPSLYHSANMVPILNEQLQAIYEMSEAGISITKQNVIDHCNKKRVAQIEASIENDVKNGLLKQIEEVKSENDFLVYKTSELLMAFTTVDKLEDPAQFLGKQSGDTVGDITILKVYEVVKKD